MEGSPRHHEHPFRLPLSHFLKFWLAQHLETTLKNLLSLFPSTPPSLFKMSIVQITVIVHPPAVNDEQRYSLRMRPTQTWSTLQNWVASTLRIPLPSLRFLLDGRPLYYDGLVSTYSEDLPDPLVIEVLYRPTLNLEPHPVSSIKPPYPTGRDL